MRTLKSKSWSTLDSNLCSTIFITWLYSDLIQRIWKWFFHGVICYIHLVTLFLCKCLDKSNLIVEKCRHDNRKLQVHNLIDSLGLDDILDKLGTRKSIPISLTPISSSQLQAKGFFVILLMSNIQWDIQYLQLPNLQSGCQCPPPSICEDPCLLSHLFFLFPLMCLFLLGVVWEVFVFVIIVIIDDDDDFCFNVPKYNRTYFIWCNYLERENWL